MGKGVVYAKDTVNFIGNRIGCFWILAGLHLAEKAMAEDGLDIETIDALMSDPIGIPPTGLYGLVDLIGLDVMFNVGKNLQENLPDQDPGLQFAQLTANTQAMYDSGQLGRKTGGGFYKLIKHDDGSKSMEIFDMLSQQWRASRKAELAENEQSLSQLFGANSVNARFVKDLVATTLCYSADLVPDISDDIINIDRAMRWGFAWKKGPFQLIDEIGAENLIGLIRDCGQPIPKMLQVLIDAGESTFYRNEGTEFLTTEGTWQSVK